MHAMILDLHHANLKDACPKKRYRSNRKGARFEYHANVVERFAGRPVLSLSFPAKVRAFGEEKLRIGLTGCFLKVIGVMRFAAV